MLWVVQHQLSARSGMVEVREYLAAAQTGVEGWTCLGPHSLPHLHSRYTSNQWVAKSLSGVVQV